MENEPKDNDFEVVEEVIDDFDYFYEDEEEVVRNIREKNKLKLLSILICVFVVFLIILFTGMIQMKVYNTSKYVSKELIRQTEYMDIATEAYDYAKDFYTTKSVNNQVVETGIYIEMVEFMNAGQFMIEDLEDRYLFSILDVCNKYIGDAITNGDGTLETVKLPKDEKYKTFNECLIDTYMTIYNICDFVKNNGTVNSVLLNNYINSKAILSEAYLAIQQN